MSGEITEKIFKMIFPLFISITITRTQKIRDSCKHIPFHFFFISINIYIFATKVKAMKNSVHKLRNYLKESPLFCYTTVRLQMETCGGQICYPTVMNFIK